MTNWKGPEWKFNSHKGTKDGDWDFVFFVIFVANLFVRFSRRFRSLMDLAKDLGTNFEFHLLAEKWMDLTPTR